MTSAGDPTDRHLTDHGRERKQQILDASMELFKERGYRATRIQDICERAGVAKGLFYWYFPTKLDLFTDLLHTVRHRLRQAQTTAMTNCTNPVEQIRVCAVATVRFMAKHAAYFDVVDDERAEPTIARVLEEGHQSYRDDLVRLITAAQTSGILPAGNTELLAIGVHGAVISFSKAYRKHQIEGDHDEIAEFAGQWVIDGLYRGTPAP